jgi:predicted membrane protein
MKSHSRNLLYDAEGKGIVGCLVFIVLLSVTIFLSVQLIPVYYSYYAMESELKREISKAGAHSLKDEAIASDVLEMAKRNEVPLKEEDIQIERAAGQVIIDIDYAVPINFIVMQKDFNFNIRASSFVGAI